MKLVNLITAAVTLPVVLATANLAARRGIKVPVNNNNKIIITERDESILASDLTVFEDASEGFDGSTAWKCNRPCGQFYMTCISVRKHATPTNLDTLNPDPK
jgi:hypothetical protein